MCKKVPVEVHLVTSERGVRNSDDPCQEQHHHNCHANGGIAAFVLMVVAALAAPFLQRDVIMVGADLRALPAYAPMSRTTASNAFMSAVNNKELWMWDPWSGDKMVGYDDVELDGWNLVPARRSPYGTRVRAPASRAKRRWESPTIVWDRAAVAPNDSLAPVMLASGSSGSGGGGAGIDAVGSAGHAPMHNAFGRSSGAVEPGAPGGSVGGYDNAGEGGGNSGGQSMDTCIHIYIYTYKYAYVYIYLYRYIYIHI